MKMPGGQARRRRSRVDPSISTGQIGNEIGRYPAGVPLVEAARRLGTSERTVREYVRNGLLQADGGGHGRPLYFREEHLAEFQPPRRGRRPAAAEAEADGIRAAALPAINWQAFIGTEELARIYKLPAEEQAAAFEAAVRRRHPHLIGALEARYPTLSGSTVARRLRREVVVDLDRARLQDAVQTVLTSAAGREGTSESGPGVRRRRPPPTMDESLTGYLQGALARLEGAASDLGWALEFLDPGDPQDGPEDAVMAKHVRNARLLTFQALSIVQKRSARQAGRRAY